MSVCNLIVIIHLCSYIEGLVCWLLIMCNLIVDNIVHHGMVFMLCYYCSFDKNMVCVQVWRGSVARNILSVIRV